MTQVRLLQLHMPQPGEPNYSSLRRTQGPGRPKPRGNAAPQAGPRQYEPAGKRYSIDRNAVNYMGWTFQVPLCQIEVIRMPFLLTFLDVRSAALSQVTFNASAKDFWCCAIWRQAVAN